MAEINSQVLTSLFQVAAELTIQAVERHMNKPLDTATNDEVLAALRAVTVKSADALIDSGIGVVSADLDHTHFSGTVGSGPIGENADD